MKVKKVITAPWFIALVIIVVIVLLYFLYSKLESDTNAALTVINNPGTPGAPGAPGTPALTYVPTLQPPAQAPPVSLLNPNTPPSPIYQEATPPVNNSVWPGGVDENGFAL